MAEEGRPSGIENKEYIERMVISALLNKPLYYFEINNIIKPDDFSDALNKITFQSLLEVVVSDPDSDTIVVKCMELMKGSVENDRANISEYLSGMMSLTSLCDRNTIVALAKDLKKLSNFKKIHDIAKKYGEKAFSSSTIVTESEILEDMMEELNDEVVSSYEEGIKQSWTAREATQQFLEMVEDNIKNRNKKIQLSTGITDLDDCLPNLSKPLLTIIAGRPGMGKTAFALNLFYNMSRQLKEEADRLEQKPKRIIFVTMEMDVDSLMERMESFISGFPVSNMAKSNYTNLSEKDLRNLSQEERERLEMENFGKLKKASYYLSQYDFVLYHPRNKTLASLRNFIKRQSIRKEIGAVIVDYLGLMQATGRKAQQNNTQAMQELSAGLKSISSDFSVPMFVLSQMSRASEQRQDRRPELSDLRDSGAIEQDADIVMFLHREEYYMKPNPQSMEEFEDLEKAKNKCSVLIKKNRFGRTDEIDLYFNKETNKFSSLAKNYHNN